VCGWFTSNCLIILQDEVYTQLFIVSYFCDIGTQCSYVETVDRYGMWLVILFTHIVVASFAKFKRLTIYLNDLIFSLLGNVYQEF
jgi:hypothetical protein